MSDRAVRISFSPAMVNAVVCGKKRQTRRFAVNDRTDGGQVPALWFSVPIGTEMLVREPHYREAVAIDPATGSRLVEMVTYRAEGEGVASPVYTYSHATGWAEQRETRRAMKLPAGAVMWAHPRYQPSWSCRLAVRLEGVRRERLQDIEEADAVAEGATLRDAGWSMDWSGVGRWSKRHDRPLEERDIAHVTARQAFRSYWNYLHSPKGKPATDAPWQANPELAVVLLSAPILLRHPCWELDL